MPCRSFCPPSPCYILVHCFFVLQVKESVTNVVDSVKDAAGKAASAVSGAVKSTLGKLTGSGKASDDEL